MLVSQLVYLPHPLLGEMVREEVVQVALKERPASGVPRQGKMAKVPDQQGPGPMEGGATPVRGGPT
jgi:hypothetical protein